MATKVYPINVELRAVRQDERLNHVVDATVTFKILSDLGDDLQVAVQVEECAGLDGAVDDARKKLAKWAQSVAAAAPVQQIRTG